MIRKLRTLFKKHIRVSFTDLEDKSYEYPITTHKSVLDTLLDNGHPIAHACKAGICKSCVMVCHNPSALPKSAQHGLTSAEIELGHFLACSCKAEHDLFVSLPSQSSKIVEAKVADKKILSENIIYIKLHAPFEFKGGQFCNLFKSENISRSYSIASQENDSFLEFHIKHIKEGVFSHWVATELNIGDTISLQGPFGKCFYSHTQETNKPLLLCGIGTGLAPLLGVVKTAINNAHRGPIDLVIGARNANNFYLYNELTELASRHEQLNIHWVATEKDTSSLDNLYEGDIYQFTQSTFPKLAHFTVYLCGAPSFIQKMKKQCFLSGANFNSIFSDIFQPASHT